MEQQETMPTYKPSNSEVSHCHKRHVSDCYNVRLVAKLVVRRKHIGLIELNKVRYSVTHIYEKSQI